MAGLEVASLYGVLSLRDEASGALRSFDAGIAGLGDRISNIGGRLQGFGASLLGITAPLTAAMGAGIKIASDFDSIIAEISARTGITGDALTEISDYALQMGADTAFSAQQAADALLQLLSSGQSAQEALATLPAVLDAAAASGEDLGRTADTVTDIMAMFRLPVNRSRYVVDALAKAAGASSATMGDLGQGFANVGAVAASFGLSVDDTAAILATLSENGIKGAEAGTQLKSMLLNMTRPTEAVAEAWETLGTSLYDSDGNARDLNLVLDEMSTALASMPIQQQNELLQALGGSYGIVGLQALLASGGFDTMLTAMDDVPGSADIAAVRMDTFAGRVDALRGSVETLAVKALTPFMNDVLQPLAEDLTTVINNVSEWAEANPEATKTIFSLLGVTTLLGGGMVVLGTIVKVVGGAVGLLTGAVGLLMNTAMLPLTGIIAVAGGIIYAYSNNILGLRDRIDELGKTMRDAYVAGDQLLKIVSALLGYKSGHSAADGAIGDYLNNMGRGGGGSAGLGGYVPRGGGSAGLGDYGTAQGMSMRGGAMTQVNVMMPAEALRNPSIAAQRGAEFGAAAAQEMRRRGALA